MLNWKKSLAVLAALLPGTVMAADFPNAPVTLVVPYPPGGNVDSDGNFAESIAVRASGDSLGEQTNFVTSLRNGEEATVRFTLTPATGGELTLELRVDSDDSVAERDEGNNVRSEKLAVEAEPKEEEEGGLIPAPGLLAAAAVLLGAARRRR